MGCKKAAWYNTRLHKMPQYRCAIQKQIEAQAAGEREINERTYNATRDTLCPMRKSKVETAAKTEVLDFSKGEALTEYTVMGHGETQAKVEETTQTDSHKEQNDCLRDNDGIEVDDAALLRLSKETGIEYLALKDAQIKMCKAKETGELAPTLQELQFKQEVKDEVSEMVKVFTWDENMKIVFVPLIISQLAWIYAERVRKYCAEQRIPETVKLSRAVLHVRDEYVSFLKKDLDTCHIESINRETDKFLSLYTNDFTILRFSVDAAYLKQYPDDYLREMHVNAYTSLLLCRFLTYYNGQMNKLIESKLGHSQSIKNPYMVKLETCMDAYCGNCTIENTRDIDACLRILQKNLNAIEFRTGSLTPTT